MHIDCRIARVAISILRFFSRRPRRPRRKPVNPCRRSNVKRLSKSVKFPVFARHQAQSSNEFLYKEKKEGKTFIRSRIADCNTNNCVSRSVPIAVPAEDASRSIRASSKKITAGYRRHRGELVTEADRHCLPPSRPHELLSRVLGVNR